MNQDLMLSKNNINWECDTQLKTIKDIYGKKLTNEEFSTFVNLGLSTGLNPFLREIWAIKYGDSPASIFIGRDGYRKSAQANKNYDYHMSDAVYSNDSFSVNNGEVNHVYRVVDRGILLGAYCIVKRHSSSKPLFVYVDLKEYDTQQSNWKTKKSTMIKKVAEAQCLRMAFQELFSGTYDESEEFYIEKDSRNSTTNISKLIEGKSERVENIDHIMKIITDAKSLDDLEQVATLSKNLNPENKEKVRKFYKEAKDLIKLATGEIEEPTQKPDLAQITDDYEKVKKSLLNAKSKDTLDIAADLISSLDVKHKEELTEIYNSRKTQLNN